MDLTENEWAFLDAVRAGESAAGYARRMNYSQPWAKWVSRRIREKLNVETIGEAIAMSEVTHADLEAIRREQADLKAAMQRLERALDSGNQTRIRDAREDVKEAREDLDDELRRRGLTRDDLDSLAEEKEYERFKTRQERLDAERAAAKSPAGDEDEDDAGADGKDGAPDREPEQPPASQHAFDRRLWGKGKE